MIWKMNVDYVMNDILVAGTFSNSLTTIFGGCVSNILIPSIAIFVEKGLIKLSVR